MQEPEERIINVPISREIYRKLFQRRIETGVPIYKLSEAIFKFGFKFGNFVLDNLDKDTSWKLSDDAITMLHGKIFRDKLGKKRFPASDLKMLDDVIMRAEAFLTEQHGKGEKKNENRSDA
ncbi:MAG: hypothetical protein ACPLZY_02155 [Candidatus Norongarragalinales archaeon]